MDLISLATAFAAGLSMGATYFAMLWLTIRYLPQARRPMVSLLSSSLLRLGLLVAAFLWIMDDRWERLLACLLGFIAARLIATGWANLTRQGQATPT